MKTLNIQDVAHIDFSDEEYEKLKKTTLVIEGEQGNFLFPARSVNLPNNLVLIAPEENFKEVG